MAKLYLKFYFFTIVFFTMMLKVMIIEDFYMVLVFGLVWFPQILWNTFNRSRKSPSLLFVVTSTTLHLLFPFYIRLCTKNILFVKPKPETALLIGYLSCF